MDSVMDFHQSQIIAHQICNNSDIIRAAQIDLITEQLRPFMLLKPNMFSMNGTWHVVYGENAIDGVHAIGESPEKASRAFDVEWHKVKKV